MGDPRNHLSSVHTSGSDALSEGRRDNTCAKPSYKMTDGLFANAICYSPSYYRVCPTGVLAFRPLSFYHPRRMDVYLASFWVIDVYPVLHGHFPLLASFPGTHVACIIIAISLGVVIQASLLFFMLCRFAYSHY